MKINGCGLDVVVSQQFLYRVQVCSLFQQVCGKGVARAVEYTWQSKRQRTGKD